MMTESDYSEVHPDLYVSSYRTAEDLETLKALGIRYIVNCTPEPRPSAYTYTCLDERYTGVWNLFEHSQEWRIRYLRVPVYDSLKTDIAAYFDEAYNFIDEALEDDEGKVLVHCRAGVSRSATIAIMYMMRSIPIPPEEALERVREARPCVNPNPSFWRQLAEDWGT